MKINKQLKHRNQHAKYESVEINIQRNEAKKSTCKEREHGNQHAKEA